MTYVKINGQAYPAEIAGRMRDNDWDGRESKAITLEMSHATAAGLFVDDAQWSIVQVDEVPVYQQDENGDAVLDENGAPIQTGTETRETEWDNSEFSMAGDITDHRDGTVTVKMGKYTDLEIALLAMA